MAGEIPAWALDAQVAEDTRLVGRWPHGVSREWAFDSDGDGVRVCIVDSGVERDHELVGELAAAVAPAETPTGDYDIVDDSEGDLSGHGTACAGIVRSLAPACEITSLRVLGGDLTGSGTALLTGLRWAVEEGFDVINLSLSTRKRALMADLYEILDRAYFRRCLVVACAHNLPVESFPWRYSSVISVAGHPGEDPFELHYNAAPPVEFFARGVDVEVAWGRDGTIRATGNSFAAPHVTALCARILGTRPGLTPFQVKSLLYLTARNVEVSE